MALSQVNLTLTPNDLPPICLPGLARNETCCVLCPAMEAFWPRLWDVSRAFFGVEWVSFIAVAVVGATHFFIPYAESGTTPATVSQYWSIVMLSSSSMWFLGREPRDTLCANRISAATWRSNLRCSAQAFFITFGIYVGQFATFARLLQLHLVCVWGWDANKFKQMGDRRTTIMVVGPWILSASLALLWLFLGKFGMYGGDICFLELHLATKYLTWPVFVPALLCGVMHVATMIKIYFVYREFDRRARLQAAGQEDDEEETDGEADIGSDHTPLPGLSEKCSPESSQQDSTGSKHCVESGQVATSQSTGNQAGHPKSTDSPPLAADEGKLSVVGDDAPMVPASPGYVLKPETAVYASTHVKNDDRIGMLHRGQNPPPMWKMRIPEQISAYMSGSEEDDEERKSDESLPSPTVRVHSSPAPSSSTSSNSAVPATPATPTLVYPPEHLSEVQPKIERVGGMSPRARAKGNLDPLIEEEPSKVQAQPSQPEVRVQHVERSESAMRSHWSAEENSISEREAKGTGRFSINMMLGKRSQKSEDGLNSNRNSGTNSLGTKSRATRDSRSSHREAENEEGAANDEVEEPSDDSRAACRRSQLSTTSGTHSHRSTRRLNAARDMWHMNWRAAKMILTVQLIAVFFTVVFQIYVVEMDNLVKNPFRLFEWFTCIVKSGQDYAASHGLHVWDKAVGRAATRQCESTARRAIFNAWPVQVVAMLRSSIGITFLLADALRTRYWVALWASLRRGWLWLYKLYHCQLLNEDLEEDDSSEEMQSHLDADDDRDQQDPHENH